MGTVTFEKSLFDGNARFRGSQFDVAEVSFKDCHFDQGFDFVGSSFRGDGMPNFEHCIFHTLMKHMVVMLLAALDVLRSQTYGYCLL